RRCHATWACMGGTERQLSEDELNQRQTMRRSVVYANALSAGSILAREDLCFKRPGTGIAPTDVESVVGKTLAQDVLADRLVEPQHLA
ncbi:MAG: SAF domain-containing protein, partial [Pseudomonadota bacterium]